MIRLFKWIFMNRLISMAAIALSAMISAFLCYQGFILVKAIPAGATTWHNYITPGTSTGFGPGMNYVIFGLPLFLLYGSEFIYSFSRRPSRAVSSVAVIQVLLFIFFLFATK